MRGSTALLDAVGKTIMDVGYRLAKTNEDARPGKVTFVITTDGMENAFREFTHEKVKELIKHQQDKYNWNFIFIGANIDTVKEANCIGIFRDNSYSFEVSRSGVMKMFCRVSEAVGDKRNKLDRH